MTRAGHLLGLFSWEIQQQIRGNLWKKQGESRAGPRAQRVTQHSDYSG